MLDAPDKRLFIGIGALEAASQLLGFIGASKLPGACDAQQHQITPALIAHLYSQLCMVQA